MTPPVLERDWTPAIDKPEMSREKFNLEDDRRWYEQHPVQFRNGNFLVLYYLNWEQLTGLLDELEKTTGQKVSTIAFIPESKPQVIGGESAHFFAGKVLVGLT